MTSLQLLNRLLTIQQRFDGESPVVPGADEIDQTYRTIRVMERSSAHRLRSFGDALDECVQAVAAAITPETIDEVCGIITRTVHSIGDAARDRAGTAPGEQAEICDPVTRLTALGRAVYLTERELEQVAARYALVVTRLDALMDHTAGRPFRSISARLSDRL